MEVAIYLKSLLMMGERILGSIGSSMYDVVRMAKWSDFPI
jgi:hypothetical protein